jgi:hypothetical protein
LPDSTAEFLTSGLFPGIGKQPEATWSLKELGGQSPTINSPFSKLFFTSEFLITRTRELIILVLFFFLHFLTESKGFFANAEGQEPSTVDLEPECFLSETRSRAGLSKDKETFSQSLSPAESELSEKVPSTFKKVLSGLLGLVSN